MFDLLRNPLKLLNDYDSPLYETFDMKRVTAVVIYVYSTKNYIQERPTQIYANCVLYTVGGM